MKEFKFRCPYGRLTLKTEGQFLIAQFEGCVSQACATFFLENLDAAVANFQSKKWAYISHSDLADAGTPEALDILIKAAVRVHQLGCSGAAYVLDSPIAISQTLQMRKKIGVTQPLTEVMFDSVEEAKDYLLSSLT